jgi:hypothetical protein
MKFQLVGIALILLCITWILFSMASPGDFANVAFIIAVIGFIITVIGAFRNDKNNRS